MDSRSNSDYRRQGQFHATTPGYSLDVAEGSPEEESRAPDQERRVHRHAYMEERPDRSSGSVALSYPSEQQAYCGFWSLSALFNWDSQGADEGTSFQRGHDSVRRPLSVRHSMIPTTLAPVATKNTVYAACMAAHSIHFPDASLRELRFFYLALV